MTVYKYIYILIVLGVLTGCATTAEEEFDFDAAVATEVDVMLTATAEAKPDTRPRIGNCLPWQYIEDKDIGKRICVAGGTHYSVLYRPYSTRFEGDSIKKGLTHFPDETHSNSAFYIVSAIYKDSYWVGDWASFDHSYFLLSKHSSDTCIGIIGEVEVWEVFDPDKQEIITRGFYKDDPKRTYYIHADTHQNTVIRKLDNCTPVESSADLYEYDQ